MTFLLDTNIIVFWLKGRYSIAEKNQCGWTGKLFHF